MKNKYNPRYANNEEYQIFPIKPDSKKPESKTKSTILVSNAENERNLLSDLLNINHSSESFTLDLFETFGSIK